MKTFYVMLFRVSIWVSVATHRVLPKAWAWAIHLRCRRITEWSWKRWLKLATNQEMDAAGKQLRQVFGDEVDHG